MTLPQMTKEGQVKVAPFAMLDRRVIKRKNKEVDKVLIQWTNLTLEDAIWEDWTHIQAQFSIFNPADKNA